MQLFAASAFAWAAQKVGAIEIADFYLEGVLWSFSWYDVGIFFQLIAFFLKVKSYIKDGRAVKHDDN